MYFSFVICLIAQITPPLDSHSNDLCIEIIKLIVLKLKGIKLY